GWDRKERMVRAVGLEPTRIAPADFESAASTNSATPARPDARIRQPPAKCQQQRERTLSIYSSNIGPRAGGWALSRNSLFWPVGRTRREPPVPERGGSANPACL